MVMIKWYATALLLLSIGLFLNKKEAPLSPTKPLPSSRIKSPLFVPPINDQAILQDAQHFLSQLQTFQSSSPKPSSLGEASYPLGVPLNDDPLLSYRQGIEPLLSLRLDPQRLKQLPIGAIIKLPDIGSHTYWAKVSQKKSNPDGSLSLIATLEDEYDPYTIIITVGETHTFGSLYTPEGGFELIAKKEQAQLFSIEAIDNNWITYEQSDTLLPPKHS